MDAKKLKEPIICSIEDITPIVGMSHKDTAIRGLQAIATRNVQDHQNAVSGLVRLASGGKRVRANENRRNQHG